MKKFLKVVLCLAFLVSMPTVVEAQGLGGLLKKGKQAVKKGKEVVEKVLGTDEEPSETKSTSETLNVKPSQTAVATTVSSSGIIVSNPISNFIEIEPVGLFGVSKSENFGDAYLVLKVRKLIPQELTGFGTGVAGQKMIAVDNNGKVYNVNSSGHIKYDTPEGLKVQIIIDNPNLMFTDIRKDVNMMQQVKLGVFSDKDNQGNVTFTNVPIYWDRTPE